MPAREKCPVKAKVNKVMAKVPSPSGDQHAKITGSQAVAHKAIIVQGIIRGDSQADVQSVVQLSMPPHSVLVQSSLQSRMPSGMSPPGHMKKKNGMTINGILKSMRRLRARRAKGKDRNQKENPRVRVPQDRLLQGHIVFTDER